MQSSGQERRHANATLVPLSGFQTVERKVSRDLESPQERKTVGMLVPARRACLSERDFTVLTISQPILQDRWEHGQ